MAPRSVPNGTWHNGFKLPGGDFFPPFFAFVHLACAVMCIVIHRTVEITPNAIIEMIVTMLLIYGMLIVKKKPVTHGDVYLSFGIPECIVKRRTKW